MDILIPCAGEGLSTIFPNMLPKYVISCFDGESVLEKVLKNYNTEIDNIHIGILEKHDKLYNISHRLKYIFGEKLNIIIISRTTKGSADTVNEMLNCISKMNNRSDFPFLIRDCDSFFDHDKFDNGNYIFCSHINGHENLESKSYVRFNDQSIISDIVEKKIISEYFSVGGYQFNSSKEYIESFNEILSSYDSDIFISDVLGNLLSKNEIIIMNKVEDYIDVGTVEEFLKFNDKPTYFSDIDGVICEIQSRYDENPFFGYKSIPENVEVLLKEVRRGCQLVFTTSRDSKFRNQTEYMLNEMGFTNYTLLMDIHRSKRIVINDYSSTYPTCESICIKTETPELSLRIK